MECGILDGEKVLAAVQEEYMRRRECSSCGGSGRVGLFGSKGLGVFQSPCVKCSAHGFASGSGGSSGTQVASRHVSTCNVTVIDKSGTRAATVPGGNDKKTQPFLAAPFWAAQPLVVRAIPVPPEPPASQDLEAEASSKVPTTLEKTTLVAPRFNLQVQLADGSGRLEFQAADDLPKLVDDFVSHHRLMGIFTAPLLERAERMVRADSHEEQVDIVDLL